MKKYKTVGGLLRKIEEVVTGTNNGKAPQLAGYYAYWERSIFSALNSMVLNAMRMLVTMLHARSAKKAAAAGLPARPPLFKVTTCTCFSLLLHWHTIDIPQRGVFEISMFATARIIQS